MHSSESNESAIKSHHRRRSVKFSRMIVNLSGSKDIHETHLAEALQYCPKLMMG